MTVSDLDALRLSGRRPVAPARGANIKLVAPGTVLQVDPDAAEVLVQIGDGEPTWIPGAAGRYVVGGACEVLSNPLHGGRSEFVFPVDVDSPAKLATLEAIDSTTNRARVVWPTGAKTIPFIPSTYTVGSRVWVLTDEWGVPQIVLGPSTEAVPTAPVAPEPLPVPTTAQTTAAVFPQWSGTWRSSRGAWDRWNVDRYGGRSTLYQGNGFGSGALTGLAVYGDQLVNLGATTIHRVRVMLRPAQLSGAAGPATVTGSPHGTRPAGAPSTIGDVATGEGWVDLPASMYEAMRTGVVKGLALVGANYWAVLGAGSGDGMALEVTYTRPI